MARRQAFDRGYRWQKPCSCDGAGRGYTDALTYECRTFLSADREWAMAIAILCDALPTLTGLPISDSVKNAMPERMETSHRP